MNTFNDFLQPTNISSTKFSFSSFDPRLGDFLPGLLVPTESVPSVTAGFCLLFVSIYSLTTGRNIWIPLRIAIAPLAIYFFWDFGYGPYPTPSNQVSVGLAVVGLYGIMRVLETTFVGLMDERPPHWVQHGKEVPLPQSTSQRLRYSLDLATSLRGNSWFENTHWNWAPRPLVNSPTGKLSRREFISRAAASLLRQYILIDALDTLNKSRTWDTTLVHPITSLPILEQLPFSLSVCAGTALSITLPYTVISTSAVLLGSSPASWPPMFDSPFIAFSLTDFWTRRWHAIFRRVFERLSTGILRVLHIPSSLAKPVRAIVIFALSASLHIMLMYRIDKRDAEYPMTFLDPSILKFFLSQPLGLAIEALVITPLAKAYLPEKWRVTATRVWAWCFLLWAGRFWSDVWVHRGLWQEAERVVGYSVVRGILWGKWAV